MAINVKCPKCGGTHVQLSNERSKHGCIWFLLFGIYYICWVMVKWIIGLMFFICYDWWAAIIHSAAGKVMFGKVKSGFPARKEFFIATIVDITLRASLQYLF